MMKEAIVLDTNCLIQILPEKSCYHRVWTDFLAGRYWLCVTNDILEEYEEILCRFTTQRIAENVIDAITHSRHTIRKETYYHYNLINADPDDNKFVDCALAANAKYIVTNDAHFNILKTMPFPKIEIISLKDFAAIHYQQGNTDM